MGISFKKTHKTTVCFLNNEMIPGIARGISNEMSFQTAPQLLEQLRTA
jgi:hypothetical protein